MPHAPGTVLGISKANENQRTAARPRIFASGLGPASIPPARHRFSCRLLSRKSRGTVSEFAATFAWRTRAQIAPETIALPRITNNYCSSFFPTRNRSISVPASTRLSATMRAPSFSLLTNAPSASL